MKFRRSLYLVRDLEVGDVITADAVRSVRPGYGLAPKYLTEVVGKHTVTKVVRGTPVKHSVIG